MLRIAVVGSLVMDLVVQVPRLPLAGEALTATDLRIVPGGKGSNQAIAAARLGAEVAMIGAVGEDAFGHTFLGLLDEAGIDRTHVRLDGEAPTGIAMPMVMPGGQNSIVVAPSANLRLTPADIERAGPVIAAADMLLLQLEVAAEANLAAARLAARAGVPVLLNPAPAATLDRGLLDCVSLLVPNAVEAAMLTGMPGATAAEQARALYRPGMRAVVVTLGEEGAVSFDGDAVRHCPAYDVEAIDTVGAGDAFVGALAIAICDGNTTGDAIRFACGAGALATIRRGASPAMPWRADLEAFLTNARSRSSHDGG